MPPPPTTMLEPSMPPPPTSTMEPSMPPPPDLTVPDYAPAAPGDGGGKGGGTFDVENLDVAGAVQLTVCGKRMSSGALRQLVIASRKNWPLPPPIDGFKVSAPVSPTPGRTQSFTDAIAQAAEKRSRQRLMELKMLWKTPYLTLLKVAILRIFSSILQFRIISLRWLLQMQFLLFLLQDRWFL